MKRTCEAMVLIVLATSVLVWAQGDAVMKVLADARIALGGPALDAVKTMTATGHATRVGTADQVSTTDVEMALERPDKFVERQVLPAMMGMQLTRTFGFNGTGLIDAIERGEEPANANPNMHVFARTPLQSAQTPERAAELARAQLTKNYQEFTRFELGLFLESVSAYPVAFAAAKPAGEPCGKADAVAVTGAGGLSATLYLNRDSHRPACLTFMAREPAPPVSMGGMAVSAAGGMQVFAGGPPASASGQPLTISGNPSPEMLAQMKAMQDQQAAADAKRRTVEYRITYGDYKSFDGVQVPTRYKRLIDGKVVEEFVLDKVKINPRIDPARFEVTKLPGSGR